MIVRFSMIDSLKGKRIHLICLYTNLAVICKVERVCIKRDSADDLGVANAHVEHLFMDLFFSIKVHVHFLIKLSRSDMDNFLTPPTSHRM